jgi:hypothetical protein
MIIVTQYDFAIIREGNLLFHLLKRWAHPFLAIFKWYKVPLLIIIQINAISHHLKSALNYFIGSIDCFIPVWTDFLSHLKCLNLELLKRKRSC